jgi:hypothetical protein
VKKSLKHRLWGAMLIMHTLKADDFPADLRCNFEKVDAVIEAGMHGVSGTPPEGTLAASIRAMSEDEARQLIHDIVSLYDAITRRFGMKLD